MSNPFESLFLEPVAKADPHVVHVGLLDHSGRYVLGPPKRPPIKHDNGFLDKYPKREPTMADRRQLAKWIGMLEAAEMLCTPLTGSYIAHCGGNLSDANAAYRHFLFGDGTDRTIDYDRFLHDDPAGKILLSRLTDDFEYHAAAIGKDRIRFSVTSESYTVSNLVAGFSVAPQTANWQKTIGSHYVWISANISASSSKGKIYYDADLTIHMEDRYNFNPGQQDSKTGIADAENGMLELSGLGKQYTTYGTSKRHLKWEAGSEKPPIAPSVQ